MNVAERRHDDVVGVGIGLRPDLTGRGLGESFLSAQLAYGAEQWGPVQMERAA